MPNRGFINDPLANINLLRDTLHDRYRSGFPIIKELVQNADDAKASQLRLVWTDGLVEAGHPLLAGPALAVINDGPFSKEDADAIRRMGINYKAADKGTVGKFGLGLKSIFHLCETFFFLAGGTESFSDGWQANVLNPWSGPEEGLHDEWDEFSNACQAAIVNHLKSLFRSERWFVLWIPLRLHAHCLECDPIVSEFYDEREVSDVLPADLGSKLEPVVPFLRHVCTVEGLIYRCGNAPQSLFRVEINDGFARRRFPELMETGAPLSLGGTLTSQETDGTTRNCVVAGYEVFVDSDAIRTIKKHENWPRSASLKSTRGEPEKSEPHAAIYFVGSERYRGNLTVQWSVFLPIGDPEPGISCPGEMDYSLLIHGYFFVDSGRSRIEKFATVDEVGSAVNESDVRSQWNSQLAAEGVFPLVIPALRQFVVNADLKDTEVRNLTNALVRTDLIKDFRSQVCAQQQWIYRLGESGGNWLAEASEHPVYGIPGPPDSNSETLHGALMCLDEVCREHIITYTDWPYLRASKQLDGWPDNLLARVLQRKDSEIFRRKEELNYLAKFLAVERPGPQATGKFKDLLNHAFRDLTFDDLKPVKELVRKLLGYVAPSERFALNGLSSEISQSLFRGLSRQELGLLLVPKSFDTEEPSSGELKVTAASSALKWLARARAEEQDALNDARSKLAMQLIGKTVDREELLSECGTLDIFVAYDAKSQQQVSVSFETLRSGLERGVLFIESLDSSMADMLQAALADDVLLLLKSELANSLFAAGTVPKCDRQACVNLIAECPRLAEPKKRANLLREMARDVLDEIDIKVLRYLLHGDAERFDEMGVLIAGVS